MESYGCGVNLKDSAQNIELTLYRSVSSMDFGNASSDREADMIAVGRRRPTIGACLPTVIIIK